tara:strand:- start:195 stop:407 length:213 start_codon:yes stop_codon:yes gene_type:complete
MAKYKAKKDFNKLGDKHFGIHQVKAFENGAVLEITDTSLVPKEVMETLTEVGVKKTKTKASKPDAVNGDK